MFDPMSVPMPVRAESREVEGAQHPLVAALVNHPFLTSPDDEKHLRQLRATYYGMQAEVDDQLGRLLDHLDASGEADRTIVVMTSDHGEMLGDHFLMHKLGWFDSSFHVPLIVRSARRERLARGDVIDDFTEHVDVLPTLLDLLGAEVPLQCDGRPLTGFLRDARAGDDDAGWRTDAHFEFDFRDAGSDLLEQAFDLTLEECSIAVLRDDHGKYVHFAGLPPIFFDLDTDPAQIVNRADDPAYAPAVLAYAQRMLSWRMQHQERTLAGMKLTGHAGLVERRAPALARAGHGPDHLLRSRTDRRARPLAHADRARPRLGHRRAVRRLRARRLHRGRRAAHRPAARVGDRAVPHVRAAAGRARARRCSKSCAATRSRRCACSRTSAIRRSSPCSPRSATGRTRSPGSGRTVPTSPIPTTARRACSWTVTRARSPTGSRCASRGRTRRVSPASRRRQLGALGPHAGPRRDVGRGLAIIGDFVPFGISQALGVRAGGNSLDNTLRVARRVPTDWVLADIRVTRSPTASATASCTSGPKTAHCSAPPANPRSSAAGSEEA